MDAWTTPDLASAAFFVDHYPTYRTLRDHFPVFHTEVDGEKCVILSRYQDVDAALRHPLVTVSSEPGKSPERFGPGFLERFYRETLSDMDAPHHTKVRRLLTGAFTPLAVEKMRSWIEAVVERHLARIGDNAEIDWVTDFASAVAAEVSATLVHAPLADVETLLARGHELLAAVGVSLTPDGLEKAEAVACLYYQYWEDVLNSLRRQKLPPEDIVTLLLAAEGQEDGLTHGEVVTLLFGFMLASYHMMKVALTNALEALLRHPDQKARLVAQPELARSAFDEGLRYEGPVHFRTRYASGPIAIGGVDIKAGQRLLLGLQAANRDGRRFPDPDSFIIGRPAVRHLGFGTGAHFCIGAQVARLEGEIVLQRVFQRFPNMRIKEVPSVPGGDLTFSMLMHLDLSLL
jgi:cytochrome P450